VFIKLVHWLVSLYQSWLMAVDEGTPGVCTIADSWELENQCGDKGYMTTPCQPGGVETIGGPKHSAPLVVPDLQANQSSSDESADAEVISSSAPLPPAEQVQALDCPPCENKLDEAETLNEAEAHLDKFEADETLLIFDWDDTVLPSTWVQANNIRLDRCHELLPWQREMLSEAAQTVAETLRMAKQFGTVVFVTNAERGWIELSCQRFMPTLYPFLEGIKVLSARTMYERSGASPFDWKHWAFESEISRIFGLQNISEATGRKNVVSFGDSNHEREALWRATATLPNCRSKSVKFVERPAAINLISKQHSLVCSQLHGIVHHDGHLDMHICV